MAKAVAISILRELIPFTALPPKRIAAPFEITEVPEKRRVSPAAIISLIRDCFVSIREKNRADAVI